MFGNSQLKKQLQALQGQVTALQGGMESMARLQGAMNVSRLANCALRIDHLSPEEFAGIRIGYPQEDRYKESIRKIKDYTMATYAGLVSAADQMAHLDRSGIEGAVIELGCCHGGMLALLALIHGAGGLPRRQLYAFDSFSGLPRPDRQHDTDACIEHQWGIPLAQQDGQLISTGSMIANMDACEACLFGIARYPREMVTFCKGWFQETLPVIAPKIEKIALLRLDGDLYASYKVGLEFLYDKVTRGGFVVYDDLAYAGPRKAVEDFFAARPPAERPYLHMADATVGYMIKP